jgi:hypothetical protein
MRRVIISLLSVFMLTVGTTTVAYTVDAVQGTEQEADAYHNGTWHPTWDCIEGAAFLALGSIGVISSMFQPPPVSEWNFIWGSTSWLIGAYKTAYQCFQELREKWNQYAGCTHWPHYHLRDDYIWVWPGWAFHQNQWWSTGCGFEAKL